VRLPRLLLVLLVLVLVLLVLVLVLVLVRRRRKELQQGCRVRYGAQIAFTLVLRGSGQFGIYPSVSG
jgi:hypothetical protein